MSCHSLDKEVRDKLLKLKAQLLAIAILLNTAIAKCIKGTDKNIRPEESALLEARRRFTLLQGRVTGEDGASIALRETYSRCIWVLDQNLKEGTNLNDLNSLNSVVGNLISAFCYAGREEEEV